MNVAEGPRLHPFHLLRLAGWPVMVLVRFLVDWFHTRNWRWLLVASPALIVAGVVLVAFVRSRMVSNELLATSYARRAHQAFRAEEPARAEMLFRKAMQYRGDDPSLKYSRAFVLTQMDRLDEAFEVMQEIAPLSEEEPGYPDAHRWLARAVMSGLVKVEDNPGRFVELHLRAALKNDPRDLEAHRLMTDLAISMGHGNAAIEHIAHIVDDYPETRIVYARLLRAAGRQPEARREATLCFRHYKRTMPARLAEGGKPPAAGEWIDWATSAVILDRYNDAVRILMEASKSCDDKTRIRQALADVFVLWSRRLDESDSPSIRQQLELLSQALRFAPDHPGVLQRVALLIGRDEDTDQFAESMLQDALTDGTAPAVVHFLLGTRAAARGDAKVAEMHLRQALSLNPNTPFVLNNLAWVLATRDDPDLNKALELVNQAVDLEPFRPNFRETRGQILLKLERWQDAITDLEVALRKMKDKPELHSGLALAYERMGNAELARRHRQRFEDLNARTGD